MICFLICIVWEKYNKSLDHRKTHVGREFRMSLCQSPAQSRRVRPDCWRLWASLVGADSPPPGWSHTASGSPAPVPDCPQGEIPEGNSEPLLLQLLPRVSHPPSRRSSAEPGSLSLLQTEPPQLPQSLLHLPSPNSAALTPVCQPLVLGLPKYTIHLKLIKLFLSPSSPL